MKPDNADRLRQELRLAQLEIKVLREQLLKAVQDVQRTRDEIEELAEQAQAAQLDKSVIVPMVAPKQEAANGTQVRAHNGHKPRVLYVEDSEPNFRLMENILLDRPETELLWAETGKKGLELAQKNKPQLVLLDLDLPDIHGSEVLNRLQAQPETAHTPVIVISADATPSQIERMLTAGARNYLTKPFEIRRFLYMLDEVLAAPEPGGAE